MTARQLVVALAGCSMLAGCRPQPSEPTQAPERDPGSVVEARLDCAARTSAGALGLIPDRSEWIVHVGVRTLLESGVWSLAAADAEQSGEYVEAVSLFSSCGLALADLEHLRIGFDADAEFVIVATGTGLGRTELGECLIREIQALVAEQPQELTLTTWGKDASVSIVDLAEGRVYLFGGDVLAYASTGWAEEVGALSLCDATPASRGTNKELLGQVDRDAPIWATARIRPGFGVEVWPLLGVAFEATRSLALSVRLDDGVSVSGRAQLHHEVVAKAVVESLRTARSAAANNAGPRYAPLIQRLEFTSDATAITIHASVTEAELRDLLP